MKRMPLVRRNVKDLQTKHIEDELKSCFVGPGPQTLSSNVLGALWEHIQVACGQLCPSQQIP